MLEQFEEFYRSMIPKALTLSDAKDYAKMVDVDLDVKDWITNRYLVFMIYPPPSTSKIKNSHASAKTAT
ncbi:MAG: hypothetical protein AAGK05_03870 [Pseudomonadota bacterium]